MKKKESESTMDYKKVLFPQYINTKERTIEIIGVCNGNLKKDLSGNAYKEGKGYMMDLNSKYKGGASDKESHVWIYCKSAPKFADTYPYFWINEKKDGSEVFAFSNPDEEIYKSFTIENLIDASIINIVDKTIPGEILYTSMELDDISATSDFYIPIIYETDDFLKQIVKMTIIEKGININKLKSPNEQKYILPNMRAALRGKTKMSVTYFCYWMELLNCEFNIRVSNDKYNKTRNVLEYPLLYDSEIGKVMKEVDGKIKKIDESKFKFVSKTNDVENI